MRKRYQFSPGIKTVAELKKDPAYDAYYGGLNKKDKAEYEDLLRQAFPDDNIEGFDFSKNHDKKALRRFVEEKARKNTSSTQSPPKVNTAEAGKNVNYPTSTEIDDYKKRIDEGVQWYKNNPYISKYDVNSDEAKTSKANNIKKAEEEALQKSQQKARKKIVEEYGNRVEKGTEWYKNNPSNPLVKAYGDRVAEGTEWYKNNSTIPKYDVNSDEAKAIRAASESNVDTISESAKNYGDRVSRGVEWNKNNPQTSVYDVNSAEAKAARKRAGEYRLDNLYEKTGFVHPNRPKTALEIAREKNKNAIKDDRGQVKYQPSENIRQRYVELEDNRQIARSNDLEKKLSAIENNESVKKTLNFTTRSDGSMSYSSKKDYEAAQKFINEQEAEYVKTYTDRLRNDAKYKLDEKISSFINNKNWEKEFSGMGAQQKVGLMSNLTEAQINMIKNKGLDLENIANWSEEQMGSVVKGLKEAEYMNDVKENLTREFREGVKQRANLAGYNKIASRESSVAAEMSKKMSGFKSVGKMAIGGALMYGLISALSDSGGQQSNAQLYGQQPLY